MEQIRYRELIDNLSDWVWAVDSSGVYTYCSENVYDFLGFHVNEVVGKTPFDFMSEKEAHRVGAIFNSHVSKYEKIVSLENIHMHKNGLEVIVETNGIPIFDEDSNFLGYQGVDKDITKQKKVEDSLKEKEQLMIQQNKLAQMGEMISLIAHQWRQPLAAINASSNVIQIQTEQNKLDNEKVLELSERISKYSQHLSSTIDDFREFFKPNKVKKDTTYNELIANVLNIVEISITNQNIQLVQNLNSYDTFHTYPNELKQVLLNIITNAQDVLLERKIKNPTITIETSSEVLTISDNGEGISNDIINNIFDSNFSTKLEKNGTGLGLYMSKIIIQEHCNGKLTAFNDENGAVFKIELKKINCEIDNRII